MTLQRHITIDNLKLRPIIAQTETYTYNAAQVISKYLKPPYCPRNETISKRFIKIFHEFTIHTKLE